MSRNMMLSLVALLLVVLLGVGVGGWAIKKYRQKQRQEMQCSLTREITAGSVDQDKLSKAILNEKSLDQIISDQNLVSEWSLGDAAAAKERIRQKFQVTVKGTELTLSFRDKDGDRARQILEALLKNYSSASQGY